MLVNFEDGEDEDDGWKYNLPNFPEQVTKHPVTLKASEVVRFERSLADPEWTDVFTVDGDILTADMTYTDFKVMFFSAIDFKPEETWRHLKSKDGKINIRYYMN